MPETPPQIKCIVSGLLVIVLNLSRAMGLAPITSKRVTEGWLISSSYRFSIYGKLLVVIFAILAASALIADLTIDTKASFRTENKADRILWIADVTIVFTVVFIAAYTGSNRVQNLIESLALLNEVKQKLHYYHKSDSRRDVINWAIVMFSMTFGCITAFWEYYFFMMSVIGIDSKVQISSLYIFYNIMCIQIQLLVIQFTVVTLSVIPVLAQINSCLKELLPDLVSDSSLLVSLNLKRSRTQSTLLNRITLKNHNRVIQVLPINTGNKKNINTLPALMDLYCSLCDIIRKLNDTNGLLLVSLLISFLIHLIITPYKLIYLIFHNNHQSHQGLALQCAALLHHVMNLAMIVEPCHQTYQQMDLTKELINEIKRNAPSDRTAFITEITQFKHHINMNQVTYSPMQLFTLDRSLILAMMGSITTYLVVAIQT